MTSGDGVWGHGRAVLAIVVAALVAVAVVPTLTGRGRSALDELEIVHRDGDLVVYQAKGAAAGAAGAASGGYTTYADARQIEAYEIQLVSSDGIEVIRPIVEEAAATIRSEIGQDVTIRPGQVARFDADEGEIDVVVSSRSPCAGYWLGCGAPIIVDGRIVGGRVWINPRLFGKPPAAIANTVRHELGHALGLGHYDALHEGRVQTMHSRRFDAPRYESGDLAGLRAIAGTPPGAVPPDPAPALAPTGVDPTGSLDTVASTAVGVVVRGRAVDPDSSDPIPVVITMDGTPFELVAGKRDEASGQSIGFEVLWSVPPGDHEVCVTARNVGPGSDSLLGCRPVTVRDGGLGRIGLQTL